MGSRKATRQQSDEKITAITPYNTLNGDFPISNRQSASNKNRPVDSSKSTRSVCLNMCCSQGIGCALSVNHRSPSRHSSLSSSHKSRVPQSTQWQEATSRTESLNPANNAVRDSMNQYENLSAFLKTTRKSYPKQSSNRPRRLPRSAEHSSLHFPFDQHSPASQIYKGVMNWREAEDRTLHPTEFILYHRIPEPLTVATLKTDLELYVCYHNYIGVFRHFRVRKHTTGPAILFYFDCGNPSARSFLTLDQLVQYYHTYVKIRVSKNASQTNVDVFD
ncbi:unnamed protein product, partial [Mesorhabditis belari]|uniref:SH2 domain-containing protein n=1 Tax=Mesorhabditis belari TaxID=2138241 RepID=A0AAF3F2M8_9BILA